MNNFRALTIAASVAVMTVPTAAFANLTGSYVLKVVEAEPTSYNGTQFCATLVEDGSVLGWTNSGTVTINGVTGQFIIVNRQLSAWLVSNSGTSLFTANLPGGTNIMGTAFAELDSGGNVFATGAYKAARTASC
jgi:hypothetical protein